MGAPNVPTMRDIKFHASFSGRTHAKAKTILLAEMILTDFLPRASSMCRSRGLSSRRTALHRSERP
jgi:hypothetical protein